MSLLCTNPKRVIELARSKFLVPSNVFIHFIRRLYCVFVPNRPENTEGNPDRLLLVYDMISNSATFDFLHCLYYADWRRRQVGKMYLDVLIVSRSQQFLLEEQTQVLAYLKDNPDFPSHTANDISRIINEDAKKKERDIIFGDKQKW